ncbi:hypothetical protein [Poseidonocella sedimentorum]|uniref:Uncharacterized protein n=1 Tax=Poseidonocella sedimentorum TaxID=871652 RepID=A0A1I6CT10_9RHOB|nr:hypothetical protein [Poseidonocella sedimentorum]SFQ96384.1 hypothetical protein SAMN04515673_101330 [Poseidonocella sedimentorum]
MTALKGFERLEASGIWRAGPEAQRRDVIVSFGTATLVMSDMKETALAHWSLAAVTRANPGAFPAIYHPEGDDSETLELGEDEAVMIDAIETVRRVVRRRRPHPGRLRWASFLGTAAVIAALGLLWLPGALSWHAVSVVPDVKRAQIGRALSERITRVAGPACQSPRANAALARLLGRLGEGAAPVRRLRVVPGGVAEATHLPGGTVLLNRALVEDYEEPDVVAGYVLAEAARAGARDPLAELLEFAGPLATLRLLTTGDLRGAVLDAYAEDLLTRAPAPISEEALLARFAAAEVPVRGYAYARDVSGETVLELIEADAVRPAGTEPLLSDGDWLSLQAICGG